MGQPSAAHEPSMEEILASIRQIISEDGEQPAKGEERSAEPAEPQTGAGGVATNAADDADDTDEALVHDAADEDRRDDEASPPARAEQQIDRTEAPTRSEMPAQTAEAVQHMPRSSDSSRQPAMQAGASDRRDEERNLLSPNSGTVVSGAFSALAHTILAQNARTLEDLVSEMLRPMLKEWLDDNLPALVERLVKEEIDRVSRGRR